MAAARMWDVPILASDIDEIAVDVARANVAANGLEGRTTCLEAAGLGHPDLSLAVTSCTSNPNFSIIMNPANTMNICRRAPAMNCSA